MHLSELRQLLRLSGRKRHTFNNQLFTLFASEFIRIIFHRPEHFLLLPLQAARQQSVLMVTSALLPSLICDGFRDRGRGKRLD